MKEEIDAGLVAFNAIYEKLISTGHWIFMEDGVFCHVHLNRSGVRTMLFIRSPRKEEKNTMDDGKLNFRSLLVVLYQCFGNAPVLHLSRCTFLCKLFKCCKVFDVCGKWRKHL